LGSIFKSGIVGNDEIIFGDCLVGVKNSCALEIGDTQLSKGALRPSNDLIAIADNDKDNDIGDTVAEQKAFGVAYAKAILEYLGVAYKPEVQAVAPKGKLYRVQVGAYSVKANAEAMQKKLKAAGFDAIIKEE
jgi:hypothetical protein